jgi:hypothetical protein
LFSNHAESFGFTMVSEKLKASSRTCSEAAKLESQKKALEVEKLTVELQMLRKPWRAPELWVSSITPLVALVGLGMAFYTGFFDNQRLLLDIKKTQLDLEVRELAQQRDSFVATLSHELIVQTEIFFFRDLDQVLSGGWLYEDQMLSAEMFPEFFSLSPVSPEFLENVRKYLAQVAWDRTYQLTDLEKAELRPPPEPPRDSMGPVTFHCWVPLRLLLGGSARWLRAHALECSSSYDRAKGETNYSDMMKLRERHRIDLRERFVKKFPPLRRKLKDLAAEYKLSEEQVWAMGVANPAMKLTGASGPRSLSP